MGLKLLRLAFFTSPILSFRLKGITLSDYLFITAFIFSLFKVQSKDHQAKLNSKLHVPMALIFLAGSFSVIVNQERSQGFFILVRFIILLIFIPSTLKLFCRSNANFLQVVRSYMHGLIFFSVITAFTRIYSHGFLTPTTQIRSMGLAEHVTDAGGICAINIVAILIFFPTHYNKSRNSILFLAFFALGSTGSVSGYIASTIGVISYMFKRKNNIKKIHIAGLICVVISSIYLLDKFLNIQNRIDKATSGRYDTASSRLDNWASTIQLSKENLRNLIFGRGLNPNDNLVLSNSGEYLAPHNIILESLSAAGIFFAIGIFLYLATIYRQSFKYQQPFNFAPLLTTSIIFAMTSPLMYSRYIWLPFLLLFQQALVSENKLQNLQ